MQLGFHHLAFYRAYLEGLDLGDIGARYLGIDPDARVARGELNKIRQMLIAAARRAGRPHYARLFLIPREKLELAPAASGREVPQDLEAWREQVDPDGCFTEAELLEMFLDHLQHEDPQAARKAARNDRLRRKLRDALAWIERVAAQPASKDDPVEAWFDAGLANRLQTHGYPTLGEIVRAYRTQGLAWAKRVPGIGKTKAQRIVNTLAEWGLLTPATPVAPSAPSSTGIVPIDRLVPPHALSGATGTNRDESTTLSAINDRQAIHAWLMSLSGSAHTRRSYRKEAERFLLWCIFERGKPMSSATVEDCAAYRDFLADIGTGKRPWPWRLAEEDWIGKRQTPRWSPEWRPFSGRLTLASQRQAVVILTLMHEWLVKHRYLRANPWLGVPPVLATAPVIRKDRHLTKDQIRLVLEAIDALDDPHAQARARAAFLLAYHTGARLSELASLRVAEPPGLPGRTPGGFRAAADGEGYELEIVGKGRRLRTVPVSSTLLDALSAYMSLRGYGPHPATWPSGTPLIAPLPDTPEAAPSRGLTSKCVYELLKKLFRSAARLAPRDDDAIRLYHASPHWLRHSHATHALEAGAPIQDVQDVLGHTSPATTAIYSHSSLRRKRAVVESL